MGGRLGMALGHVASTLLLHLLGLCWALHLKRQLTTSSPRESLPLVSAWGSLRALKPLSAFDRSTMGAWNFAPTRPAHSPGRTLVSPRISLWAPVDCFWAERSAKAAKMV